jgi:hypothetical protein
MSQYMLLVYEEELDQARQAERGRELPMLVELHASLREAGCWLASRVCARLRARRRSACAMARRRSPTARSR